MNFVDFTIYLIMFISLYFEIFLMLVFIENRQNIREKKIILKKSSKTPSVTIIVPCWNEESTVVGTITSLLNLDYPKEQLSIHIVDDGSTDSTLAKIQQFKNNPQVQITHKENGGKHTAMNIALETAQTEFIGCLDADSYVKPDALLKIVQHFNSEERIAAVTPAIKIEDTKNILGKIQKSEFVMSIFIRKTFALIDAIFVTPGPFSIMDTEIIRGLGGWKKAHSTEDMEMGIRLQKMGYRIENEPEAIVYTRAVTTLPKLYTQRVRWTYGFLRNAWDYRTMFFNRRYGNLGVFILPSAVVSVLSVIFLFFVLIYKTTIAIMTKISTLSATGINMPKPVLEIFYINTTAVSFVIYATILATLILIIIGKNMSKEEKVFSWDIPLYIMLYGFIAPLWVTGAFVKAALRLDIKWK